MRNVIRVALALSAMMLVGCGGRPLASGKEAAAGALFQASRGALGAPGAMAQVMSSGAFTELSVSCQRGGKVAIKFDLETSGQQTGIGYDLVYDGCSYDGRSSMHGTLHMTFEVVNSGGAVSLALHLSGRVEFRGEISDFVQVDITESVTQNDLSSPTISVSLTLNGTIATSSGTYTFDHETIVIDGSNLQKAPDPAEG